MALDEIKKKYIIDFVNSGDKTDREKIFFLLYYFGVRVGLSEFADHVGNKENHDQKAKVG